MLHGTNSVFGRCGLEGNERPVCVEREEGGLSRERGWVDETMFERQGQSERQTDREQCCCFSTTCCNKNEYIIIPKTEHPIKVTEFFCDFG